MPACGLLVIVGKVVGNYLESRLPLQEAKKSSSSATLLKYKRRRLSTCSTLPRRHPQEAGVPERSRNGVALPWWHKPDCKPPCDQRFLIERGTYMRSLTRVATLAGTGVLALGAALAFANVAVVRAAGQVTSPDTVCNKTTQCLVKTNHGNGPGIEGVSLGSTGSTAGRRSDRGAR
jgi:hypothetical protein